MANVTHLRSQVIQPDSQDIKEANIPLDENIIIKTLRLANKVLSLDLMRIWIKKCRP